MARVTRKPKSPAECAGQDTRRGSCAKTITPQLDSFADEKCRIRVPARPRDGFRRQGRHINKYYRYCTPTEISRFPIRDDTVRTDIERETEHWLKEADRLWSDRIDEWGGDYDDYMAGAFSEALNTASTKHGSYAEIIPPYYRWYFWQKLVEPRLQAYFADSGGMQTDTSGEIQDPYYYLPPDMADAAIIWTGSSTKAMDLIFNPEGVDLLEYLDRGNYGTTDRLAVENFEALVSGKASQSTESKKLQKSNKVKATDHNSLRELYLAIAGNVQSNPCPAVSIVQMNPIAYRLHQFESDDKQAETIFHIKQNLINRSRKPWSVKKGKGTARAFIYISAPPSRLSKTGKLSQPDRAELIELFNLDYEPADEIAIPGGARSYTEWIDRSAGVMPRAMTERLWD